MKKRILQGVLVITALIMTTRCGDDAEKPKTIPEVTTGAVTDITTTSASVAVEITDDGNASITERGLVYSSAVGEPTIADTKLPVVTTEDEFTAELTGLSSGTTYHVRAYATNSKGTGYGEVVDIPTGNAAPTATNVTVTGDAEVNKVLTATYVYNDAEGDAQGASTFQWYSANDATGAGEVAIAGATSLTYTIQPAEQTKFIRFGVTPKATAGDMNGTEVKSTSVGAIGEATTVTFMYMGQQVTYGIINSPTVVGRKWLDRNLGAGNVASSATDFANYGDLFQWGRLADGHQLITRIGPNDADMSGQTGVTSTVVPYEQSSTDIPITNKFIAFGQTPTDWRNPQNPELWQGVSGTNNPCPAGWRIPTKTEWDNEGLTTIADGYAKLKLTLTGVRSPATGNIVTSTAGRYWSSTIGEVDPATSVRMGLNATAYSTLENARANGLACRCIKD